MVRQWDGGRFGVGAGSGAGRSGDRRRMTAKGRHMGRINNGDAALPPTPTPRSQQQLRRHMIQGR